MLKRIILKGEQKKVLFLPPTNPIQIKGVAGSGKTTVALYRAKHLLDVGNTLFQESKVVIFTYSKTLAAYIRAIGPYISSGYQKDSDEIKPTKPDGLNVSIVNFHSWAFRFLDLEYDSTLKDWEKLNILENIVRAMNSKNSNILSKSSEFFKEEISWIKGKLISTLEEYRSAKRTGRGSSDRVTSDDKEIIWLVYLKYQEQLLKTELVDFDDYAILSLRKIESTANWAPPYTHIIIDEAQDLSKAQITVISKLVSKETESLSIIADAAQRIFKSGFTWSEVGLNVRGGRTIEFRKNYRNSAQIAMAASSLLENEIDKSEFTIVETPLVKGQKPIIGFFDEFEDQLSYLEEEIINLIQDGEISSTVVLHRTNNGVKRIQDYLNEEFETELIKTNNPVNYNSDSIKICTMSSIKGLEFNNVFILDLNDDVFPFPPGFIDKDDEYHISTERRLLYTCMTRARRSLYLFCDRNNPSRYIAEIDENLLTNIKSFSNSSEEDDLPF